MVKKSAPPTPTTSPIYGRVREILDAARSNVARTVNTTQAITNWLIAGREIVEEEQLGKRRAAYGEALLRDLVAQLTQEFGKGWSVRQLEYCRSFSHLYLQLLGAENSNAARSNSDSLLTSKKTDFANAVRAKFTDGLLMRKTDADG